MMENSAPGTIFNEFEEERFRLLDIIEYSLNEIYIFDSIDLKFEYVNKGALENLGYTAEEIVRLSPVDLKPEFDERSFRELVEPLISGSRQKMIFETAHQRKNGTQYPVEVHLQLHHRGGKKSFFAIINDITQRKISEEILKESEEKYKSLYFNAPLSYQSLDVDGNFLDINPMWLQTLGYERDEVVGKWFGDFLAPEFVPSFRENFSKFKAQGYTNDVQFRMRCKDGSYIYVSFDGQVGRNTDGSFKHTYCVFQDITDRKATERALQKSEAALLEAQHIARVGSWEFETENEKTRWSKEMFNIFGRDQALGEPTWMEHRGSIHPDDWDVLDKAVQQAISDGTPYSHEFRIIYPDGRMAWAWTVGKTERDDHGKVSRLYGTVQEISDRKQIEENLQKNKERWESLFNNSPSAIAIYHAVDNGQDFVFSDVNLMVLRTENMRYEDMIGKRMTELFPSVETQGFLEIFRKVYRTGKTEYMKSTLYKDNRIQGWRENTIYKLNTGEVVAIYNDVSDRMNAEVALRLSEQKFRSLFENHSAIKLLIDPATGDIVDANPVAARYYGWPLKELKQMNVQQITTSTRETVFDTMRNILEDRPTNKEFKHKLKDGSIRDIEVFSSKIEIGEKTYIHSINHDITERKKAEAIQHVLYTISNVALSSATLPEMLKIIREELGKLLDSTNFYIAFYDEQTDMLSANIAADQKDQIESWPAEKSLTGYVIRHHMSLLARDSDIALLRKTGEVELIGTASKVWLGVPMMVNKKAIGAIVVQSYDNRDAYTEKDKLMLEFISNQVSLSIERKKAEHELKEALVKAKESDRLKSAFLANMSHEIRTPMNGILGFLELLSQPDLEEKNKIRYIDIINRSGQRLLSTINDLIEISKIETGEKEVIYEELDISDMMKFYLDFFIPQARSKDLSLTIRKQVTGQKAMIRTDKHKMDSILTNLIKNAIKFTAKGSIELGNYVDEGNMVFYVSDTGCGIPADRLDAIFERFVQADIKITRAHEGSGLGLSIVKAYVEMLNGKLWVESEVGKGSTFHFSIPYMPVVAEKAASPLATEDSDASSKKVTILVAEDDNYSYMYVESILNNPAFTLIHAPDGEETLKICRDNPSVSLILMDIKMPGMNGLEATRQIRRFNKKVPIIAQSAYALEGDKDKALKAGCNDYISKPIKREDLIQIINKYTR